MSYKVRWCVQSDLDAVAHIELKSFDYPLEYDDFIMALRRKDHVGLVIQHDEKTVGFLLYQVKKSYYNLVSIAVHPDHRNKGAGSFLLSYLKSKHKKVIKFIISDEKTKAHCFFKKNEFIAVKVIHEHFGPHHDGYEFVYDADKNSTLYQKKLKRNIKRGSSELG